MKKLWLVVLTVVLPACSGDGPGEAPAASGQGPGEASAASAPAPASARQVAPALEPPPAIPDRWRPLIGEFASGGDTISLMEDGGELKYLRWGGERSAMSLVDDTLLRVSGMAQPVVVRRDPSGRVAAIEAGDRVMPRLDFGTGGGRTFRIDPVRPVDELRPVALEASPPEEAGEFRDSELVELTELDSSIQLDVRYATTDNFMGARFYTEPRSFLQRPAAEALVRAHRWLNTQGYGVVIFDAYRPWHVTKMFWDATPDSLKLFVANPAGGSRHNRGGAVDLTLYDLATGEPVAMPGGYDEFSPRSFAAYRGGTMRQRWFRNLLRLAMESQGFAVYEAEWWHFDHEDWRHYRLGNQRFEELAGE